MTTPPRTRTGIESARRVSDCVTALLRDQPFFGSLALRLPLRIDPGRETLASDGQEIRYAPQWVADTDADLIKTAIGRVVLACALKHHTRRGERDPERWQRASQLVTHGLLRDAGFKLPPDAEAWDGISVEQAYDHLPDPQDDEGEGDGTAPPSAGESGDPSALQSGAGDDGDGDNSSDGDHPAQGDDPQGEDAPGEGQDDDPQHEDALGDGGETGAPSFDPSGTGEVMDAAARDDRDTAANEAPVDINDEEQAWDEAMHQALNLAKAQGKAPGAVEETIRDAHTSIRKDRMLAVAREVLGVEWAHAHRKDKKAVLATAMETAFAKSDGVPLGVTKEGHAAALAWAPPGFRAFDKGRIDDEEDATETQTPPADRAQAVTSAEPATQSAAGTADDTSPEAPPPVDDPAPTDKPTRASVVESIVSPGVAEREAIARTGRQEIDAMNAVPTADGGPRVIINTVGIEDDETGEASPEADTPVPPVPGNGHAAAGDGLEIPAFLRRS